MLIIQKYFECCKKIDAKNLDQHEFKIDKIEKIDKIDRIVITETSPKRSSNLLYANRDSDLVTTQSRPPSMIANSSFSFGKYASQTTFGTFFRSTTAQKSEVPSPNTLMFKSMKDLKNSRTEDLKQIDIIPERPEKRQSSQILPQIRLDEPPNVVIKNPVITVKGALLMNKLQR